MSFALEVRIALVEEGVDALLSIVGRIEPEQRFLLERLRNREAALSGPWRISRFISACGKRRDLEQARARSIAVAIKASSLVQRRGDAELEGALAGDAARRQHDVGGDVLADRARQPLRAAAARRQRPSSPSGRPSRADVAQMMMSQQSAISKPPPSA